MFSLFDVVGLKHFSPSFSSGRNLNRELILVLFHCSTFASLPCTLFDFFNPYYIITSEENNWRICSPFNLPLPCNKRVVRDWARKNKEDILTAGKSYSDY